MGLSRWTDMAPEKLIAALGARFDGVGRPEYMELVEASVSGKPAFEYATIDSRFGMRMHTFVRADSIPRKKMYEQVCKRLACL